MPPDFATITRNADTKAVTLTIVGNGKWVAYAGPNTASVNFSAPLTSGDGPGVFALPSIHQWACFALQRNGETILAAERHLPMAGGYNFRDLGGIKGAKGKRVTWGKFFRTDGLENLTKGDLAYLSSIPVVTIVDFRTEFEKCKAPDKIPCSVKSAVHTPVAPGFLGEGAAKEYTCADEFMLDMYRDLALNGTIADTYRAFMQRVQNTDDVPILFHCSAGKDRTGIGAALILFALGAERETVLADYTASNKYLDSKYGPLIAANPENSGLYTVKAAFLLETITLIEKTHGSMEKYLINTMKVDIKALREKYLY